MLSNDFVRNLQIDVSDESYKVIVVGLVKHDGPDSVLVPHFIYFFVSFYIKDEQRAKDQEQE